jgi:predicted nucleic acid-binding protein
VDAFDADVLIYAAVPDHPLGRRIRALFRSGDGGPVGIGSVLLVPEVLTKPFRTGAQEEFLALRSLIGRVELRPTDRSTAQLATALGASYGLRALDAVHLATAVLAGADRFLTNNKDDFPKSITEIDVTYPEDLPDVEGEHTFV